MPTGPMAEVKRRASARPHTAASRPVRFGWRLRHGLRQPRNWAQLVRFGVVGASGYAVNILIFALCLHALGIDYRLSAVIAWVVSVLNNFWLNRRWTFATRRARASAQIVRFFVVSALVFGLTYLILVALVGDLGVSKLTAQAIAIAAGTPVNFVAQKLWTFQSHGAVHGLPVGHAARQRPRRPPART